MRSGIDMDKEIYHRREQNVGFIGVGESSFAAYELFSGMVIVSSGAALSYTIEIPNQWLINQ